MNPRDLKHYQQQNTPTLHPLPCIGEIIQTESKGLKSLSRTEHTQTTAYSMHCGGEKKNKKTHEETYKQK